jgi:membrane protein DedA with SNARE-associated domain
MKRRIRNILIVVLIIFPVLFMATNYLEDLVETSSQEGSSQLVAIITGLPSRVIVLAAGARYVGVFALMLLESAAFPVPSEIILPLAGYLVFRGTLQFWPVVFCSTAAALIGSYVDYLVGRHLGSPLISGQARLPYLRTDQLQKTQAWFNEHGPVAVALLRLVPTARVLISFPAGACRMSPGRFACYTLLGCLPWNITLVYAGWWLGTSWPEATSFLKSINLFVYVVIVAFIAWVVWRITVSRRKRIGNA